MEESLLMEKIKEIQNLLGAYWIDIDYLIDFAMRRRHKLILKKEINSLLDLILDNFNMAYSTDDILLASVEDFITLKQSIK